MAPLQDANNYAHRSTLADILKRRQSRSLTAPKANIQETKNVQTQNHLHPPSVQTKNPPPKPPHHNLCLPHRPHPSPATL
jgi:hypothetical protein